MSESTILQQLYLTEHVIRISETSTLNNGIIFKIGNEYVMINTGEPDSLPVINDGMYVKLSFEPRSDLTISIRWTCCDKSINYDYLIRQFVMDPSTTSFMFLFIDATSVIPAHFNICGTHIKGVSSNDAYNGKLYNNAEEIINFINTDRKQNIIISTINWERYIIGVPGYMGG